MSLPQGLVDECGSRWDLTLDFGGLRLRLPFLAPVRFSGAVPHEATEWASIDLVLPRVHSY